MLLYIVLTPNTASPSRVDYIHTQLANIWDGWDVEFGAQVTFPARGGPQDWPDADIIQRANNQVQTYPPSVLRKLAIVNYEPWGAGPDPELVADVQKKMLSATYNALSELDTGGPGGSPGLSGGGFDVRPIVMYQMPHLGLTGVLPHDHYDAPSSPFLTALSPSMYMATTVHPQPRDLGPAEDMAVSVGKPLWPVVAPLRDGDGAVLEVEEIEAMLQECIDHNSDRLVCWVNVDLSDSTLFTSHQRMVEAWEALFGEPVTRVSKAAFAMRTLIREFSVSARSRSFATAERS